MPLVIQTIGTTTGIQQQQKSNRGSKFVSTLSKAEKHLSYGFTLQFQIRLCVLHIFPLKYLCLTATDQIS